MYNMRYFCLCILFILSLPVFTQTDPNTVLINLNEFTLKASANNAITNKASIKKDTIRAANIKNTYWNHAIYNPYKNLELQFPFKLVFKDSTYHPPIRKRKVITSRYGWRHGRGHKGIDIDLVTGDSLYSMFDGIVRLSRYSKGHGKTVVIRHYNGLETVYAHLSAYGIKENDSVLKGQYIGKGGVSGNARGSHLHLVINYKGVSINPEYLFNFNTDNTIRANEIWVTKRWTQPIYHHSKKQAALTLLRSKDDAIASLAKKKTIYVVKSGDTLSQISKGNNVSISSICRTNTIKRNAVLKIGQQLIIEK